MDDDTSFKLPCTNALTAKLPLKHNVFQVCKSPADVALRSFLRDLIRAADTFGTKHQQSLHQTCTARRQNLCCLLRSVGEELA